MNPPEFVLDPGLASSLERAGLEFLVDFLTIAVDEHPANVDALAELGHALSRLGRCEEGLTIDRRLVGLLPENPEARYNLACSLALCGRPDEAFAALEHAVDLGYTDVDHLQHDEDLRSLRSSPRWAALVERLTAG